MCARARRCRGLLCAVLTAVIVVGIPARVLAGGDTVAVAALKAAFLYNFAKFSEWPTDTLAPGQPLAMCVVGDAAVADALGQTIKGHALDGHELTVAVLKVDESASACHLLYVSAIDTKRSAVLLQSTRSLPVFTVSDADRFAESGGVAQLIVENDRMRFAINLDAVQRTRIHVSPKLLSLARIVKDVK
jgi:hypothetical protein